VGTDIDGESWTNPPSIGCDEFYAGAATNPLSVSIQAAYTNLMPSFTANFTAVIGGRATASQWDFGDGTVVSNRPYASYAWGALGDYAVVLRAYNDSNPGGVSATVMVHVVTQPVHYVAATNTAPVPPYSSWETAATNIQDALDAAAVPGALVLVNDGIYSTGGRVVAGVLSNRVAATMSLVLQSMNGPAATIIQGAQEVGTTNGDSAVRCAYLANGVTLAGFTLTNGATRAVGDGAQEQSGGGVWCNRSLVLITNCVITGNSAAYQGGGAYYGTLTNCVIIGNSAGHDGGGAYKGTLYNCTLTRNMAVSGGGVFEGTLNNCTLAGNWASAQGGGGGAQSSVLINCLLTNNSTAVYGGGAVGGTLSNSGQTHLNPQ
jgi:hypothetical protein